MKRVLGNIATTLGITVLVVGILFGIVFGVYTWTAKDTEREFNNGICNACEVGTYEFTNASEDTRGDITYFYSCDRCSHTIDLEMQMITEPKEKVITVDDVVSKAGCDYFIVKDVNTWAVLEEDVYMDREVVEINICDDTENTLCIFIELAEDETPRVRNN
jgi:hypothetical protein